MRLIDADKLLYDDIDCTDGNTYMVVYAPQIDNAPTAFDLESVIRQLEEKASHSETKAAEYEEKGNTAMMDIWDTEAKSYRNAIKILKSAANATNGKNGG